MSITIKDVTGYNHIEYRRWYAGIHAVFNVHVDGRSCGLRIEQHTIDEWVHALEGNPCTIHSHRSRIEFGYEHETQTLTIRAVDPELYYIPAIMIRIKVSDAKAIVNDLVDLTNDPKQQQFEIELKEHNEAWERGRDEKLRKEPFWKRLF